MTGLPLYMFGVLLFVAVVLAFEGTYTWWNNSRGPEAKRLESRLRIISAGVRYGDTHSSIVKERLLAESPGVQRVLARIPRIHVLDRFLEQSGATWSVAQFLVYAAAAGFAGLALGTLMRWPWPMTLLCVGVAALLPWFVASRRKRKRLDKIDMQLPDALDLMSRAMRAGHALPGALKMVADELSDPVGGEFGITFDEVNYGIAMKEAMLHLANRVPIKDLRYFVIAVMIQRETGGNLAELLDSISSLIRARQKLRGTIRVLSAEGRLSATILCVLPFVAAALVYFANPKLMAELWTDPMGIRMLVAAAVMMLIGILWSRKIVRIHI
jgi:tight adherence protein B